MELKTTRKEISRSFDIIEAMLQQNYSFLKFTDDEVKIILKVNSYIDQSELLMYKKMDELNPADLLAEKENYIELIKDARRTCMSEII